MAYWDSGVFPKDYVRPWVMMKETSAGPEYHPILTDMHHYMRQNIVDPPNMSGQVLRPPPSAPFAISILILRQSIGHSHLHSPDNLPIAPQPLSPLNLPVLVPFQHALSVKQTTTLPIGNTLPSFLPHTYADPFPGNWLAPIPDLEKENDDPKHPTSPPYDPEQVVRDHEALCLPSPTPQSPPPTHIPTPLVDNSLASPIVIDTPAP